MNDHPPFRCDSNLWFAPIHDRAGFWAAVDAVKGGVPGGEDGAVEYLLSQPRTHSGAFSHAVRREPGAPTLRDFVPGKWLVRPRGEGEP